MFLNIKKKQNNELYTRNNETSTYSYQFNGIIFYNTDSLSLDLGWCLS